MPRRTFPRILFAAAIGGWTALSDASVTHEVDRYGPGDGTLTPPENVVIADVFVDVTDGDSWVAGGINARTLNGAVFCYRDDPNDHYAFRLMNPGTANRFVTFFSEPRPRDSDERFEQCGAAWAGRICHGPVPIVTPTRLDVAFFASPPETIGSPTVDGAILRIDVSRVCGGMDARVFHAGEAPPGYFPILLSEGCAGYQEDGTVSVTFDDLHTFFGVSWGLYVQHEFPTCDGDVDCDRVVGLDDLSILLGSFGACQNEPTDGVFVPRADVDADGCIDLEDLQIVLSAFGTACE